MYAAYDKTNAPRFSRVALRGIELVDPAPDATVIDIACGPGTLSLPLSRQVRQVVAVDFSGSMIELLRQKCRDGHIANVSASVADGMALPFADGTFDAAFSCFGLFLFADRASGLSEMRRVVKPESKVMLSSWAPTDGPIEAMYRIVREVLPELPFQKGSAPLGTDEEIRTELTQAGLTDIAIDPVTVPFCFPSVEAFWNENSLSSPPIVATRRRVQEAEWPTLETRILDTLRALFPTKVEFERQAWIAVARTPDAPGGRDCSPKLQ
ncbi:MAG TPA: methyltransferase domain-containing protein [Polyangiaceae bacterium]